MHVIITCKYEKDRIKIAEKKWQHRSFFIITLSVAIGTRSRIWPNFKLIQALMYVIVTFKYEMDPIQNSQGKVATPFFPIISLWGLFQTLKGYYSGDFEKVHQLRTCLAGPVRVSRAAYFRVSACGTTRVFA